VILQQFFTQKQTRTFDGASTIDLLVCGEFFNGTVGLTVYLGVTKNMLTG
jgi:hypothetical protein